MILENKDFDKQLKNIKTFVDTNSDKIDKQLENLKDLSGNIQNIVLENEKLQEDKKLLSIYFTAGYPKLNDTVEVIESLEKSGVDFIEIGLPFSDPIADGPTIQASSTTALENGMTSEVLFNQLKNIFRKIINHFSPDQSKS